MSAVGGARHHLAAAAAVHPATVITDLRQRHWLARHHHQCLLCRLLRRRHRRRGGREFLCGAAGSGGVDRRHRLRADERPPTDGRHLSACNDDSCVVRASGDVGALQSPSGTVAVVESTLRIDPDDRAWRRGDRGDQNQHELRVDGIEGSRPDNDLSGVLLCLKLV